MSSLRHLVLIFGDQLNHDSLVWKEFDPQKDAVWMAEVAGEIDYVWSHQLRIVLFLSAMRHFRNELESKNYRLEYTEIPVDGRQDRGRNFSDLLRADIKKFSPEKLICIQPGDDRVLQQLQALSAETGVELLILEDRHFYSQPEEFAEFARDRKELRLEYFYRGLRKKHQILIEEDGSPTGGDWNFDHANRESFKKTGPPSNLSPVSFSPDEITESVIKLVRQRFSEHPGHLDEFDLPVTRKQALKKLEHFLKERLPNFGTYEDAMWTDEAYLYHSHLSACLNLKLLNPRECIAGAVAAYQNGTAPLNSVEGFVRQILGWREFVRGIYWYLMPEYAENNELEQDLPVPDFFWDGQTDMECVRQSMQHVIRHGYAHHIHRLMVLGNLAQIVGTHPYAFHQWHMAMYVDAIDWVSLPNTLGMSQFGDGGIVGSKPYCASGNYINKMSNFCRSCRYDYRSRTGEQACPITVFYWDFLDRKYDQIKGNARMKFQIKNLERLREKKAEFRDLKTRADQLRKEWFAS